MHHWPWIHGDTWLLHTLYFCICNSIWLPLTHPSYITPIFAHQHILNFQHFTVGFCLTLDITFITFITFMLRLTRAIATLRTCISHNFASFASPVSVSWLSEFQLQTFYLCPLLYNQLDITLPPTIAICFLFSLQSTKTMAFPLKSWNFLYFSLLTRH